MSTAPSDLERKLRGAITGEVFFDAFSRGRYATDASQYQVMPVGVVVPKTMDDVRAALDLAGAHGTPVLPRGGGSSQCGQTVNEALVIDDSTYLNKLLSLDVQGRSCTVEPGIVLDELNALLRPHGLWFPVDVSTSSRATIGGMAGNNSAGSRSIRYGLMRDNVQSIAATLADGSERTFGRLDRPAEGSPDQDDALITALRALGQREAAEIVSRFPKVLRRVGGYNIDALLPDREPINLSHLLVGSEGTLAFFRHLELKLSPLPKNKVLGVCHFPTFYAAMDAAQYLVKLEPTAVELIDRTMMELAREIPLYRQVIENVVRGEPEALLLVEFAEEDQQENLRRLAGLTDVMSDLGFSWNNGSTNPGGVVEALEPALQRSIFEVRKAGLNIMMSMKDERKPISFVEDCAVALEDLAEFTARLTDLFERYNTRGTWYAHASVGCLHVRPVLNLRLDQDVKAMRAIAEEAFAMVREYKGSHSGEHGDGIVRSEFHEQMFGPRMVAAFAEVKRHFDPHRLFNPGRIVDPPAMDDARLFRYAPGYRVADFPTVFDWSSWPGAAGGFQGAVEMCNNNGACRKMLEGAMCPSYRVTRNERDTTRGRANSLRLAISGQLGDDALTSAEMAETLKLCVSCKACKRECPTGIDMAKMKIEVTAARKQKTGFTLHDHLIAWMPRYAPLLAKLPWLGNSRNTLPALARLMERVDGFTSRRSLPRWRRDIYRPATSSGPESAPEVILFGDTFNTYFESENLHAAREVLLAAGYRVLSPRAATEPGRPVCCGRTFLTVGKIDQARSEASRLLDTFYPYAKRGVPIVGLEPSCLLCLRDEVPSLLPGEKSRTVAGQALLFEEFCTTRELQLNLAPLKKRALVHSHCHQKAFNTVGGLASTLHLIPGLEVEFIDSGCCGMAGVFGYGADTYDISMQMGELSLFPAVRKEPATTIIVADGSSCRHQIEHGTSRQAIHTARVLQQALAVVPDRR
jgi:FAD/FMN-containing dehydrogenase/Fe-S oxidoreductase